MEMNTLNINEIPEPFRGFLGGDGGRHGQNPAVRELAFLLILLMLFRDY
jgi:hypothetical protein